MGRFIKNKGTGTRPYGVVIPTTDEELRLTETHTGMMRYSESLESMEFFNGTDWVTIVTPGDVQLAIDTFEGDGVETIFTMSETPTSINQIFVFVGGVHQSPALGVNQSYVISIDTLTFLTPPPPLALISIIHNTGKVM